MFKHCLIFLLLISTLAIAHSEGNGFDEDQLRTNSIFAIAISAIVIFVSVVYSIWKKKRTEKENWLLFLSIVIPTLITTAYLSGGTVYLNLQSETGGPVHWHADFEIWACGEKIDLANPHGLSNRVGEADIHEHGDDRVHIEGVLSKASDANLHNFFESIGGDIDNDKIVIPTDNGKLTFENGQLCKGTAGSLQVFVINTTAQRKLTNIENYQVAPYSQVPPGDCVIIEFDKQKEMTEHHCSSYEKLLGEEHGG